MSEIELTYQPQENNILKTIFSPETIEYFNENNYKIYSKIIGEYIPHPFKADLMYILIILSIIEKHKKIPKNFLEEFKEEMKKYQILNDNKKELLELNVKTRIEELGI